MGTRARDDRSHARVRSLLQALIVGIFLSPLVFAVLGSLRPVGSPPPTTLDLVPKRATFANYVDVLGQPSIGRGIVNSLIVAAIAVSVGTLVASLAGFAIARLPRRAALVLLGVTVAAVAIPASAVFVGRLMVFRLAGLTDTAWPLTAPALIGVTPLSVLLFAWSYHTVPRELYDLATEAGLGPIDTWWRVAVPLRKGAVAVAVALGFVVSWGNLSDPLLYVYDERWYTLPLELVSLAELPATDQGLMLAAAVIAIVPALVTAFVVQRHLFERRR